MYSNLKLLSFLITFLLLVSCKSQSQNTISENDRIFEAFEKWKKKVIADSTYLTGCPSEEEIELMPNSTIEKLFGIPILPENYSISFGDFNGDNKKDAIFSFPNYTCNGIIMGASSGSDYNRSGIFVLVTSNADDYKISTEEVELDKIINKLETKYNASRISISLEKIDGENILSGTCKIWPEIDSDDFLGNCCPSYLSSITINNKERKISLYINENESDAFDISF